MLRSLQLDHWPVADREAWLRAWEPGLRLRRGGRASHMKPTTRANLARAYGSFLGYLSGCGRLNLNSGAAAHVNSENVDAFVEVAAKSLRSTSLAQGLRNVLSVSKILDPSRDLRWLSDLAGGLRSDAVPRPRFDRLVESEMLVTAGLDLVRSNPVELSGQDRWHATQLRNGLMMALLVVCPIRLKNFADLRLGESFRRSANTWWIILGAEATKTGRPDERPVSSELNEAIELYLSHARPTLLRVGRLGLKIHEQDRTSGALWISERGRPLTRNGVQQALTRTTKASIGVSLWPHDFRRCAASTAALNLGHMPHFASALLQHTDRRMTDAHYNRAVSLNSALRYSEIVRALRARPTSNGRS